MTMRWVEGEPCYEEVQERRKAANDCKVSGGTALLQGGPGAQEGSYDYKVSGGGALVQGGPEGS